MSNSGSGKESGQGECSVDCGYGVVVHWVPPAYRSIEEIYDDVISDCQEQSCMMRQAERRFDDDNRYTNEDVMAQRALIEGYGEYARLDIKDVHDRIISPHNGEKIAIIGEARHYNPKAFGTQWRVRLEDGTMTVAFFDELTKA